MSFDKVKAMRTAERFLSQGKLRAAISEYKRIVESDPKDYSTLNIMGDLHVKGSDVDEAVNCYTKVAEHYNKQGFAQKAIAIYNKISRLQPHSTDVSAKLAKLYQLKGSFAEARSHYTVLAEQYQRKGQKTEALEIWKQIAQLDPTNTEVYLKIAEFCWQDGNKDEAAKAFTEAGIRLSNQNQLESALTSFSRALELRQYDLNALHGFVNTQVKLGCADEAAKILEEILEKQPYNREILCLLVDCYLDVDNTADAERAAIRLVEQEPANYPKFLQLVEVYIKNGDLDSAVRILSMSSEHLLVGGKPEEFLKWTNEILARDPEQLDATRLLVRYHGWQRDESELKTALERLAEIARVRESVDDERYALSQLIMILPHEIGYAKRLHEISDQFGGAEAVPELNADFQTAQTEIPTFESYNIVDNVDTSGRQQVFDNYSHYTSEIGLNEPQGASVEEETALNETDSAASKSDFPIVTGSFQADSAEKVLISSELRPVDEMRLAQEIASVEFYITQGYTELADKSLVLLEAEFGERPDFAALRGQLVEAGQEFAKNIVVPVEIPEPAILTENFGEVGFAEDRGPANVDFLQDFRAELGLEETEQLEEGDYETHYQLATAYKEMGLMEEAIREFQEAVNIVRIEDGTRRFFHCCNLLGLCFMEQGMPNLALLWYRRAMETPNLNDEEKQALLYEMAISYEMGGESPRALEYLEQIYAVNVDYRDVSARLENLRENTMAM